MIKAGTRHYNKPNVKKRRTRQNTSSFLWSLHFNFLNLRIIENNTTLITKSKLYVMKRMLFILALILCRTLSATADTQQVSLPEALATAEKLFVGKDVDYYVLQNDNASTWTFFVDAEPTKGWEHDCYIIEIPKSFNSSSSTTIPTRSIQLRMPPTGDFVPLRVRTAQQAASQ